MRRRGYPPGRPHPPTGKSEVRERYQKDAREKSLSAGPGISALRLDNAHGAEGLTVYTTMSTSCAVCLRVLPDLRATRQAFGGNEVTLVGVPVSVADTAEKLSDYVAIKQPPYAVQIGLSADRIQRVRNIVSARLHADGNQTPASIVTDASGRILTARWGVPTISELKKLRAETMSDQQ